MTWHAGWQAMQSTYVVPWFPALMTFANGLFGCEVSLTAVYDGRAAQQGLSSACNCMLSKYCSWHRVQL